MTRNSSHHRVAYWLLSSCLLPFTLAACQQPSENQPASDAQSQETAGPRDISTGKTEETKKSIIRPDVDPAPSSTQELEPARLTVPFPASGTKPDDEQLALIDEFLIGPAMAAGGPITIWGHSDSRGSDQMNLTASRRRAESVRDYLIGKGVDKNRITVVALGESRPIAPNRKMDGTIDPEGQAKNRRVEMLVALPESADQPDKKAAGSEIRD